MRFPARSRWGVGHAVRTEQEQGVVRDIFLDRVRAMAVPVDDARRHGYASLSTLAMRVALQEMGSLYAVCPFAK